MGEQEGKLVKRRTLQKYLDRVAYHMVVEGNKTGEILIVGGAYVMLTKINSRMTMDIDVAIKTKTDFFDCCLKASKELGLIDNFINGEVMRSPSYTHKLFERARLFKTIRGVLDIYIPDIIDAYCMKLVAFRSKDRSDLEKMGKIIKKDGVTSRHIRERYQYLYDEPLIESSKIDFINKALN